MDISEIINKGANVQLVVNACDLKEAFLHWAEENINSQTNSSEEVYLSANEVSKILKVDLSTLWRWDKSGYLKKINVGKRITYRRSDVIKLLEGRS